MQLSANHVPWLNTCTHMPHSHTHTHTTDKQAYLCSGFIMNGVCVKWVGWVDLETLNGKARLVFDEDQAKVVSYSC